MYYERINLPISKAPVLIQKNNKQKDEQRELKEKKLLELSRKERRYMRDVKVISESYYQVYSWHYIISKLYLLA